jgi:hypothetical protein
MADNLQKAPDEITAGNGAKIFVGGGGYRAECP